MSTKYKFRNPDGIYFVTFSVVGWVDVFTRDLYREIFFNCIRICQKDKGLNLHAYVLMTNHTHLIISKNGDQLLENIMRDLKKFSSTEITNSIIENSRESRKNWMLKIFEAYGRSNSQNLKHQFWQQGNHPIELTDNKMIDQKIEYIHDNPVRAGFVNKPEHCPFSSAVDYSGGNSGLDIVILE